MALKAAFIFVAPDVDPAVHRSQVVTPAVELTVVAAQNYTQAEQVARALVDEGIVAIELCGGFGNEGTARIVKAVQGKAVVGAVRFDCHPGLGGKSGDALFG
jgi:2-keto-3-deoxy-6-phosphogluconate aldolase